MFEQQIHHQRLKLGLSQKRLSELSGISLPMIQLIEAGKANPSIKTLDSLFTVLNLKLECKATTFDWNTVAAHTGLLYEQSSRPSKTTLLTQHSLTHCLSEAASDLSDHPDPRHRDALEGSLLALKLHYPDYYRDLLSRSHSLQKLSSFKIQGRHIKLKRIALDRFKDFL